MTVESIVRKTADTIVRYDFRSLAQRHADCLVVYIYPQDHFLIDDE